MVKITRPNIWRNDSLHRDAKGLVQGRRTGLDQAILVVSATVLVGLAVGWPSVCATIHAG